MVIYLAKLWHQIGSDFKIIIRHVFRNGSDIDELMISVQVLLVCDKVTGVDKRYFDTFHLYENVWKRPETVFRLKPLRPLLVAHTQCVDVGNIYFLAVILERKTVTVPFRIRIVARIRANIFFHFRNYVLKILSRQRNVYVIYGSIRSIDVRRKTTTDPIWNIVCIKDADYPMKCTNSFFFHFFASIY